MFDSIVTVVRNLSKADGMGYILLEPEDAERHSL